jgi:hypothetical protein
MAIPEAIRAIPNKAAANDFRANIYDKTSKKL